MEGGARKVITVRSSLMVKNRLDVPMEVRLDSPSAPDSKIQHLTAPTAAVSHSQSDIFIFGLQTIPVSQRTHPVSGLCSAVSVIEFTLDQTRGESILSHSTPTVVVLTEPVVLPPILPAQALAIPLHLTSWRLQARPKGLGLFFCKVPIHWTNVERPGELSSSKRECQSADLEASFR